MSAHHANVFGRVIYAYTRAQALADGALVAVSSTAREAGFTVPTAITRGVHALVEAEGSTTGQATAGRLWDVLFMARFAARLAGAASQLTFEVFFAPRTAEERGRYVDLVLHIGPGDEGEPVITIMLPGED
jgi:hypothetical protein